ncbi:cysteine peptidase family C39 domain-containing protein [uncultured Methanobrevibacter sp.]|uniref:cysteine peptidase family C39 domain-containing protein n=1 Tax=uncultured Methanobrevibacter sp. TaxID=253161 RepID=UPI0025FBD953|nr:cysteine peptidase family C39 domain-containing protein [uncultured Methanobrevibacter sp.]
MSFLDFIFNIFKSNKKNAKIITKNLSKQFGENTPLEVGLFDDDNNPIADKDLTINIHGKDYSRKTDSDGIAKLNINLIVGEYEAKIEFIDEDYNYTNAFCKVTVNPVLTTQDMKMTEHDGSQFIAIASNVNGVRLSGVPVTFTINGKSYEKTTDMVGEAKLNINLAKGDYDITTSSYQVIKKNTIHIDERPKKNTFMEGVNISKAFSDPLPYQCAVYDDAGRVAGTVDITVNGKTYERTPDSEGLYKLNIHLNPGTYQLIARYRGDLDHLPSQIVNTIHIVEDPKEPERVYNPIHIKYQPNSYTCGPTSLSMCSQILGDETSINAFANACYTDSSGTSPTNLIAGARKLGFKLTQIPRNVDGVSEAIENGKPVIAHIMTGGVYCLGWQGNYGHYIVIYEWNDDYYYIADPTKGLGRCSHSMIDNAMRGYDGIKYYSVERI